MHPAKDGFSALPFFDEFDLSTVDILLISQYVDTFLFNCLAHCFPFPVERSTDLDGLEISPRGMIHLLSDTLHVYQSKCRYSTIPLCPCITVFCTLIDCQVVPTSLTEFALQIAARLTTFLVQLSRRPFLRTSIRPQQDQLQRPCFHDPCHQGNLQVVDSRQRPGQQYRILIRPAHHLIYRA